MNLEFINDNNNKFSLGSVSFNILDKENIFDNYNEDNDYYSDVIFMITDNIKCSQLSNDINNLLIKLTGIIREDMQIKLKQFSQFINQSNKIIAKIN